MTILNNTLNSRVATESTMHKAFIKLGKQKKIMYLTSFLLVVIIFNVLLNNTLHKKIHKNGQQLTQQIYELQINANADKEIVQALVQSKGFMLTAHSNAEHFKYLVNIQHDVFSYKTLSISLYHWPAWVEQAYLFLLLNLIMLGAASWWVRWWKVIINKPTANIPLPRTQTKAAKKPSTQIATLNCEVKSMYGATTARHSLFAIVKCDCVFDENTDIQASFKVMIAKYFKELPSVSVNLFDANNVAITLNNIPVEKLDTYSENLHECVYQICRRYRSTVKRKNIKVGLCDYRYAAEQPVIFKLAKSALLFSEKNVIQHWHRLTLQHDQEKLISCGQVIENIKKKKFILFFQPLFMITSGDIVQHEVLIRIRQQPHGLLAARYFINQGFDNLQAFELDKAVLLQVKKLILTEPNELAVSINLHISNWFNEKFWDWFVTNMQAFTKERKLQFEISEADFIKYQTKLTYAFEKLTALKSVVVIDNVQSVEHIDQIASQPIASAIKLGYALVHNVDEKAQQQKQVKNIVAQSKLLNMPVYAVGVETQKELLMLAKLGVVAAQGFYFSEPLQEYTHATFY
ncbi:EAL domain-containing protein [Pseudoalteromonas sp. P1-13-1a]|nr:EAL domain-containing protein [Pseudoalteromonas sp. P1-13-1a]